MSQEELQNDFLNNCHLLMTLMIGLHDFFKCLKNVGQDSVSGIVGISRGRMTVIFSKSSAHLFSSK
jgi:hypothetical protein